ncbi:hypothetical protein SLEP1_g46701 [Rubroshorea leprosula]|uniref:Uncharacterized protein n=1 Tax=Rubroshorea leprosula TaxID=152421 RepID=A0AAV5LN47_9ROSI|nr:hypothetical protein SLEP1_g46701 [Rubroshorea leprosula]
MYDCAIPPLTYTILLRCIGCCELPFNAIRLTKICKFL